MEISELLHISPVIPVVTIQDLRQAISLAKALLGGGITIVEITLRTPEALKAIQIISEKLPTIIVGAGTVTEPEQFEQAKKVGARFIVSPGLTPPLMHAAKKTGLPYLPGVVTPCEILAAKQMGFSALKLFPAEMFGGIKLLKSYLPLFPDIQFCPTGGISRANMKEYLSLPNVIAVGGTWITPDNLIQEKNWDAITTLAREAVQR